MIFDAFLVHFWDEFYMFFAYLFEQCFCLLFLRTFFKCMHTFKTRDLQNTLFFSSKNAILKEPPLQKTCEKIHFRGWSSTLFLGIFFVMFEAFPGTVFRIDFWTYFWTKNGSKMGQNLVLAPPQKSHFFRVVIFGGIFVDFGFTFGVPLAPFGLILVPLWLKLEPFWRHLGPDFGYFAPSGFRFGSFWAKFIF